jgi:hypothetical protein
MIETSINWEDDHTVLAFTLGQRIQSEHGVARVPREELDRVSRLRSCIAKFQYERNIKDGNPFHGNLLFAADCGKPVEKMIASALALAAEHIVRG